MEAAFFDLDKTVISKSSSLALTRPFYRAGLVTRSQLLKGAYAQLVYLMLGADARRMDRAKAGMLALTTGWDKEEIEDLVRQALEEVIDPYIYQEAIDLSGSFAYTDSITDQPMLEEVGNPVAVNPDRELRRIAEQRGWRIRDFRTPVRLRSRLPSVPRPSPVSIAVAAALAALLAWVLLRPRRARRRAEA